MARARSLATFALPLAATAALILTSSSAPSLASSATAHSASTHADDDFVETIQPILAKYCFGCHGPDEQEASIRLDEYDPDIVDGFDTEAWHYALDMIHGAEMPPAEAPQMKDDERRAVVRWIEEGLEGARRARAGTIETVLRRLNRAQYAHTIRDLLDLDIDFAKVLPSDAKSKSGFTNNGATLQASTLHLETYQEVARRALEEAIAIGPRPEPVRYRVTFGKSIGRGEVAGSTGGYQAVALDTNDFVIDVLGPDGEPRELEDEGEAADMAALKKKISVGLRGSSQNRFRVGERGLVLYGAVPHREVAPGAWQGPSPNAKLEMQRVFPESGRLAMRVVASRGSIWKSTDFALLPLPDESPRVRIDQRGVLQTGDGAVVIAAADSDEHENLRVEGDLVLSDDPTMQSDSRVRFTVPREGYWQLDLVHPSIAPERMPSIRVSRGDKKLELRPVLDEAQLAEERVVTTVGAGYLKAGGQQLRLGGPFFTGFSHLVLTPLPSDHDLVQSLDARVADLEEAAAEMDPVIRVFAGTRTDDGMDYRTFAEPRVVTAPEGSPETYTFFGRLENLPVPEPESGDKEILSGFLLLGLWNDHLVKERGATGPPLLVESIEVEAPYVEAWPPPSHREIFFDSETKGDETAYAREVIATFLGRAFRRPASEETVDRYHAFWRAARPEFPSFEESIREVLVAVLCSPRFLYLAEPVAPGDDGVEAPVSGEYALATRLSYFLWNSPPDERLVDLASKDRLRAALDSECDRMLDDPRSKRFIESFAHEWLRMDRLEDMRVDPGTYPAFTRFVKRDMRTEALAFIEHVFAENLPVMTFVDSDFVLLNQNLAEFYGIDGVVGPEFRVVELDEEEGRGGLLSQGAFLVGHSDGVHPHPIKRAVWVKEKILGDSPPPPPPNVPDLDPTAPGFQDLTLKEQLEKHRDSASCRDCHAGIDPYGIAFERYGATGLLEDERKERPVDAATVLPDGTSIDGVAALKRHFIDNETDAIAGAFIEHLFAYALGRDVSFTDEELLESIREAAAEEDYRVRRIVKEIVQSPAFVY